MNKYLSLGLCSALLLASCGTPSVQQSPANQSPTQVAPVADNVVVLDLAKTAGANPQRVGKGSLSLSVNFGDSQDFSTKANVSGNLAELVGSVTNLEVFLLDVDSGTLPTAGVAPTATNLNGAAGVTHIGPSAIVPRTIAASGSSVNVLIKNVPANAQGTGKYYIGVRALNGSTNISGFSGYDYGAGLPIFVSSTGGDGTGQVGVNAAFIPSSVTTLGVNLNLRAAAGATLDAAVTVTDGAAYAPGVVIE